jgi:hypothetical protein
VPPRPAPFPRKADAWLARRRTNAPFGRAKGAVRHPATWTALVVPNDSEDAKGDNLRKVLPKDNAHDAVTRAPD